MTKNTPSHIRPAKSANGKTTIGGNLSTSITFVSSKETPRRIPLRVTSVRVPRLSGLGASFGPGILHRLGSVIRVGVALFLRQVTLRVTLCFALLPVCAALTSAFSAPTHGCSSAAGANRFSAYSSCEQTQFHRFRVPLTPGFPGRQCHSQNNPFPLSKEAPSPNARWKLASSNKEASFAPPILHRGETVLRRATPRRPRYPLPPGPHPPTPCA